LYDERTAVLRRRSLHGRPDLFVEAAGSGDEGLVCRAWVQPRCSSATVIDECIKKSERPRTRFIYTNNFGKSMHFSLKVLASGEGLIQSIFDNP
jgi:hypothetical protein